MLIVAGASLSACGESEQERQTRRLQAQRPAQYTGPMVQRCASKGGLAGYTDRLRTPKGVAFSLVTPRNYDPTRPHPLLIVYAPAQSTRFVVERVTGFTAPATHAGFLLVYADHAPLGPESTRDLAHIAEIVSTHWCVDESRIFHAGHSDGGTVAHALAAMPRTRERAAGIAASAAGMTETDLAAYGCPRPRAVMVLHATRDTLFPGWGARTARWWAACNGCDPTRTVKREPGCVEFMDCDPSGPTRFCEHPGGHVAWPPRTQAIVDFFASVAPGKSH